MYISVKRTHLLFYVLSILICQNVFLESYWKTWQPPFDIHKNMNSDYVSMKICYLNKKTYTVLPSVIESVINCSVTHLFNIDSLILVIFWPLIFCQSKKHSKSQKTKNKQHTSKLKHMTSGSWRKILKTFRPLISVHMQKSSERIKKFYPFTKFDSYTTLYLNI